MSSPQPIFDFSEGQRRKVAGMDRVALNSHQWQEEALQAITRLARIFTTLTADDLHVELELLCTPEPHHKNAWGSPFRRAAQLGILKKTPATMPSERADARGREVRIWQSLTHPNYDATK